MVADEQLSAVGFGEGRDELDFTALGLEVGGNCSDLIAGKVKPFQLFQLLAKVGRDFCDSIAISEDE